MAYKNVQIGRLAFVDVTFIKIAFKFIFGSQLTISFKLDALDMLLRVVNDVTTLDNLTWIRIKDCCLIDSP